MDCGTCHHDNETDAKFCGECGAPMAARCRACDARQPPGSKFCNQCGTPMPRAPAPATSMPAPPAAVRKQVTALFADLVGSTAFGERVDPEAARAALAPYFEILRATVEGHAGTVVKFTGDGVMAIFGIPEVAEDDAVRAVAAGLELQRRFRGFADTVRDRHALELGLRVGINTGELVIAAGDADLVGDVLNTAARIEAACEPGRVTVGEDTWRLTRSNVSYEVLGEVTVKGKAEALATFQVVDDDRSASEDATPFVGRAAELATLRSAFDDTVTSGVAKLVTVVGAPGVGKTRLAAELRADVAVRSFDLRFERRGSTTFTPIVELLRELTRSGSPEDVALLVAGHHEAARLADVLSSFLGHGDARSTEESFWAVRRLFEHLAAAEPLVIVVDDIQWAEALFWDLLDHLVEWAEAPVLLVALARPELREMRPELTQAGRRVSAAVSLEGLDADMTRELAARLLDTDELPSELVERIPASTEGNPLFVRELVQMLVDDGTLAKDGARWHLTIDADAIEVPPTVLSLLASRVERLPDDERQVVELASVIGTEFDRGLLAAIAGPDVSARLGALIDRLRRKDLVEPPGTWAGDHPVYRFHHVLVRDAAYRRLLKGHRADLHERVGRYIEQLGHDGDESDVVVAFHYEQVHRYRSELGTLDDGTRELARLAAGRLGVAADQALERDDLTASGSFAERALALTDDHDEHRELLLLGCEALLSSGDVSRGGALVDAMDRVEQRDERFGAWADCFRAQLWSLTDADRLAESESLADDAADRLDALDDQAGVAKARLVRAACLARLGRVGDCEDELDLALGAARAAGDRRRTVAVLGAAPLAALWGPSPVARAGGRCLDVLRLLRITTASPAVEATSVRCQGMLEALRGRLDAARTKLEQSRATAREIGLRQGLFETELFAGLVELLDGDPVAAEPHLRAARDGLGRLGIGADAGQAAALLGRALLRQGRIDEADDLAGEALASAGQNLQTAIAARAVQAEVRSAQGRHDEASSLIAEAAGIAERTDVIVDHALVELAGVVVAEAAHDRAAVRRHRERARQLLDAKGVILDLASPSTQSPAARASTPGDATTARTYAYERIEHMGADYEDPEFIVVSVADGLVRRVDIYATEADAMRRFEELEAGHVSAHAIRNAASDAVEEAPLLRSPGDVDGLRDRFHPDFVGRHRGRVFAAAGDMDRDEWIATVGSVLDDGGRYETDVVAIRGDDLAISRVNFVIGDDVSERIVLTRLDGALLRESVVFEADDLHDALDWLDRSDAELRGPSELRDLLSRARRANLDGDREAIRELLAPGFHLDDRRRLGIGDVGRDDYVRTSTRTGTSYLVREIVADSGRVAVARSRWIADDGSSWDQLDVVTYGGGRFEHIVLFDPDGLEPARALFEQLTSQTDDGVGHDRTLESEAAELGRRMHDLMMARDLEGLEGVIDDNFVGHSARRFRTMDSFSFDEFRQQWFAVYDTEGAPTETAETVLAVRGDTLALVEVAGEFGDAVSTSLALTRSADGRLAELWFFDADDLPDALDELDLQFEATLDPVPPSIVASRRLRAAFEHGDVDAYRALLSDDLVSIDHRTLGMGSRTAGGMVESLPPHGITAVVRCIPAFDELRILNRIDWRFDDGSALAMYTLAEFDPDTHLATRFEQFDESDGDAALARFHELAGTPTSESSAPASHEPTNDAVVAARRTHALFGEMLAGERDQESLLTLVHPTYRGHTQTRLRLNEDFDGDQFLAQWIDQCASTGPPTRHDFEPIAVRGSTLCLARLALEYGDDHLQRLLVTRIEDGLIAEHWWFEPDALHDALDLLNKLWTPDGMDPHHDQVESRYRRTFASGTADDFRAVVTDDYVFRDHRKLGLGVRGLDDYLATSGDFFGRSEMIITEVLNWSGPVVLLRATFRLLGDDQIADPELLTVTVSRGDRLAVQEPFDPDDLDAARARFDELVAEHAGPPAPARGRRPVDVIAQRSSARWAELAREINLSLRDRDSLLAFRDRFHPDFVGRWASTLFAALDDADRDEFLEVTANVIDMGQRLELTISEARCDRLALAEYTIWADDSVAERLMVMRLDDGLFREFVVFDRADADAARAELDRQWRAVSGVDVPDEPLRNLAVDLAMLTRRAIMDDEYDELGRWRTDGFAVRIERRANPYRSLDGEMYVDGIRSTARLGLLPTEWEAIEIRGQQLALVRCDMIAPDTGDVLGILALVHVDAEGRGLHTIEYEPEDIDIARRELDRRWAEMNEWT